MTDYTKTIQGLEATRDAIDRLLVTLREEQCRETTDENGVVYGPQDASEDDAVSYCPLCGMGGADHTDSDFDCVELQKTNVVLK